MENLEKRIRAAAAARGLTVAETERRAGVSNGTVSKTRTSSPSIDKVVKLADALRISLDELCGRKERNNAENKS